MLPAKYISLDEFLEKQDQKWKDDTRRLEKAILLLDDMLKTCSPEVTQEELKEARDGLLQCMFMDIPSNIFQDAFTLWESEQDRRED